MSLLQPSQTPGPPAPSPRRRRGSPLPWLLALLVSVLFHAVLSLVVVPLWQFLRPPSSLQDAPPAPISFFVEDGLGDLSDELAELEDEPVPPEEELPEPDPVLKGQIVEIVEPEVQERPVQADYLAEFNRTVPEETRTEQFKVNPDILSDAYSKEQRMEFEDVIDLGMTEPSTGARVGGDDSFDPAEDGALAGLPSPFALTNKDGLQAPVPSSHRDQRLAGAPQNDRLDEALGDRVALNSIEIKYADYVLRIRRLVNFYWSQNLDNLPHSVRLARPSYETVVDVVLDGNGALESIVVTTPSGSEPIDNCVVDAFRIAGPFPNPPEQLIARDGRVYLPDFAFTVEVGHARAPYMGVDPRQGVRYPGIIKATH